MKNGWRKVVIFSLIIIILETICAVLIVLPFYSRQMVFSNIEKGNSVKTRAYYDMLSDTQQENVQSYLEDFAATLCSKYISGGLTYDQTVSALDALGDIDRTHSITAKYINDVASNEFKVVVKNLCKARTMNNTEQIFSLQNSLDDIGKRLDNDTKENLMIQLLSDEYRDYLNEIIGTDELLMFCSVAEGDFYYEAYDYSKIISQNAATVLDYRNLYYDNVAKLESNRYFEVIDACKGVSLDEWDEKYKGLFDDLYNTAYEEGKIYYVEQLNNLASGSNKKEAVMLMNEIEAYYGSEVDISDARSRLISDWQQSYLDYTEGFDVTSADNSNNLNTVLLYDINEDNIPEMFLFDIDDIENNYVGCEVFNSKDGICRDLGYYNIINLCDDGYIITVPSSGVADEAYALTEYDGEGFAEGTVCKKSGETYYVNGEEVSDADYLSVRTGILSHISPYTIENSKNSSIEDSMEYIMLFGE
ncbi:MAG: hypothetical protein IJV15_08980 [Lachnospiraceae bacterium]|nr:hypothetical protein [Lachnospiraceae bacterium]